MPWYPRVRAAVAAPSLLLTQATNPASPVGHESVGMGALGRRSRRG